MKTNREDFFIIIYINVSEFAVYIDILLKKQINISFSTN